jgi:hypothetical protein
MQELSAGEDALRDKELWQVEPVGGKHDNLTTTFSRPFYPSYELRELN